MQVKTNLEGEHNGVKFTLYDGFLCVFGSKLTKQEVQTIVEISSLLTIQGYKMRTRERRIKHMPSFISQMGGEPVQYDDEDEDFNK